jgi:hypothetical protein
VFDLGDLNVGLLSSARATAFAQRNITMPSSQITASAVCTAQTAARVPKSPRSQTDMQSYCVLDVLRGCSVLASDSPPTALTHPPTVQAPIVIVAAVIFFVRGGVSIAESRCRLSSYAAATATTVDMRGCGLTVIPTSISSFEALRKLDLGGNALTGVMLSLLSALANLLFQFVDVIFFSGQHERQWPSH